MFGILANCMKKGLNPAFLTPDFEALSLRTFFTVTELKMLAIYFEQLCDKKTQSLEEHVFLQLPEFAFLPMVPYILAYQKKMYRIRKSGLDADQLNELDDEVLDMGFEGFVGFINVFSCRNPESEKIQYLFNILSSEKKPASSIAKEDFKSLLCCINQQPPSDKHMNDVVDSIWRDSVGPGVGDRMRIEQFSEIMSAADLHSVMTLNF